MKYVTNPKYSSQARKISSAVLFACSTRRALPSYSPQQLPRYTPQSSPGYAPSSPRCHYTPQSPPRASPKTPTYSPITPQFQPVEQLPGSFGWKGARVTELEGDETEYLLIGRKMDFVKYVLSQVPPPPLEEETTISLRKFLCIRDGVRTKPRRTQYLQCFSDSVHRTRGRSRSSPSSPHQLFYCAEYKCKFGAFDSASLSPTHIYESSSLSSCPAANCLRRCRAVKPSS